MSFSTVIYAIDALVMMALSLVAAVVTVHALVDCARRRPEMFTAMGRRTKGFWLALTGASALVCVAVLWSSIAPLIFGHIRVIGGAQILQLVAVVIGGVYLADVRKAVS